MHSPNNEASRSPLVEDVSSSNRFSMAGHPEAPLVLAATNLRPFKAWTADDLFWLKQLATNDLLDKEAKHLSSCEICWILVEALRNTKEPMDKEKDFFTSVLLARVFSEMERGATIGLQFGFIFAQRKHRFNLTKCYYNSNRVVGWWADCTSLTTARQCTWQLLKQWRTRVFGGWRKPQTNPKWWELQNKDWFAVL